MAPRPDPNQDSMFPEPQGVPTRVPANRSLTRAERAAVADTKATVQTRDSFQNFALNLGIGTNNALSYSTYGFNPTTRIRTLLEWMYRGNWVAGVAVDLPADDMTRAGVDVTGNLKPEEIEQLQRAATSLGVWTAINDNTKWSRLYGGSIAVMLIDGQNMATPLREETIQKDQFKGLAVYDRWWLTPSLNDLVTEFGPNLGLPKFYTVAGDGPGLRNAKIHYSRILRQVGVELPYTQRLAEDLWGLSIYERLYDRMVAYDSATQGLAQLMYKSHVRTYKLDGLRELLATGGDALLLLQQRVEAMRKFQSIEGMTLLDGKDEYQAHNVTVQAGFSDAMLQFAQQIAGALQIPLVRLLGQSPAGLNATGESDLRTYYDGVANQQQKELLEPVLKIYRIMARSLGLKVDDTFNVTFRPLWQMSDNEKADFAQKVSQTVADLEGTGVLKRATALRELRQLGRPTGIFTNITDEEVNEAEEHDEAMPSTKELMDQEAENAERTGESGDLDVEAKRLTVEQQKKANEGGGVNEKNGVAGPNKTRRTPAGDNKGPGPLIDFHGLQLMIETERGDVRRGPGFAVVMPADYGFIRATSSAEGAKEQMDCFIGPARESQTAFVIDGYDPISRAFDEHKVMLGFASQADAVAMYRAAYHDAREAGGVTPLSISALSRWLREGDMKRPLAAPLLRAVP